MQKEVEITGIDDRQREFSICKFKIDSKSDGEACIEEARKTLKTLMREGEGYFTIGNLADQLEMSYDYDVVKIKTEFRMSQQYGDNACAKNVDGIRSVYSLRR